MPVQGITMQAMPIPGITIQAMPIQGISIQAMPILGITTQAIHRYRGPAFRFLGSPADNLQVDPSCQTCQNLSNLSNSAKMTFYPGSADGGTSLWAMPDAELISSLAAPSSSVRRGGRNIEYVAIMNML